jgi:hypothetical protein
MVDRCIAEGNRLSTIHRVNAVKKNGNKLTFKMIAYYEVHDNTITFYNKLTRLISCAEEDQDIGFMSLK